MEPVFFASQAEFHAWLDEYHSRETELLLGFYKTASGREGITYAEALDEALCYGWIDGIRKGRDHESYTIRFTPRKPGSIWSKVNIAKVKELQKQGRMKPAGLAAYEKRKAEKTGIYSFENEERKLDAQQEKLFKANKKAWEFFQSQPPHYRKAATWWVISAKREETRLKRLQTLIGDSGNGLRIKEMRR